VRRGSPTRESAAAATLEMQRIGDEGPSAAAAAAAAGAGVGAGAAEAPADTSWIQTECSICLQEFQPQDEVICLPCDERHFFHTSCVTGWLRMSQLCPVCRTNISDLLASQVAEARAQEDSNAAGPQNV